MTHHDCWFCKFTRGVLVVGMSAMGAVCLVASVTDLFRGRFALSGREFLGVPICAGMIWLGLKFMQWNEQFWNWAFKGVIDEEDDQKTL